MPERLGSSSPLTVVLALIAGLAIGSNPSFTPVAWARALFGGGPAADSPPPSVAPPPAPSSRASDPGRPPARTPELEALRQAEQALFPDVFAKGSAAPASLLGTALPPLDDFSDLAKPDIDVPRTPAVGTYVRYFTQSGAGRELMDRWLERRHRYRAVVERALEAAGLPRALEAVVIAESGYHPRAVSTAGAVGLWQLMPDTARAYGLRVDTTHDERRDPVRATESAVKHLVFLRDKLASWELVLASYNAGLKRVEDCLRAAAAADYWTLAERPDVLPQETRLYVPKVLALALVLENLDTFSFGAPGDVAANTALAPVSLLPAPLGPSNDRPRFGMLSEIDPDPALTLHAALAPRDSRAIVVVPTGRDSTWNDSEAVTDALGLDWAEAEAPISALAVSAGEPHDRTYRVMPGDTLSRIATKFEVSPQELAEINGIDNLALVRIGQSLKIPGPAATAPGADSGGTATVYFASPGDSVSKIARSFGISERQVILDNDLKDPGYVREGQILRIVVPRARARSFLDR